MKKLPQRDPSAAYTRKAIAARRAAGGLCSCGETRPEALVRRKKKLICHECIRKEEGMTTKDGHHFAGESNSSVTIQAPVNDHVAELNTAQKDWPKQTLENKDGSPLLAAAGCVRGFIDTVVYLIEKGLHWVADMLETLDEFLIQKMGEKWWVGTSVEKFAPQKA